MIETRSRFVGPELSIGLGWIVPQRPVLGAAGTLRPEWGLSFAGEVEVHQREAGEHAVAVLGHALVSHPVEAELLLHDSKHMLHLGPDLRLGAILAPL